MISLATTFLIFVCASQCAMDIASPSDLQGQYLSIGYFLVGKQGDWMLSGTMIQMDDKYGCDVDNPNLAGKIAAVTKQEAVDPQLLNDQNGVSNTISIIMANDREGLCGSGKKAQQAKKNGAIGIVIVNSVLFNVESGNKPDTTDGLDDFPMIDLVPKKKYNAVVNALRKGQAINVTIVPDKSPVADETIWAPITVVFFTWSFANIAVASVKLFKFIKAKGPSFSLPQTVLALEIWANLWKILWSMEPDAEGRGFYPYGFQSWTATYSWPFSFIATIMIAFYWKETIKKHSQKTGLSHSNLISLNKMKIPAIITITILLIFEHLGDALRAARQTNTEFSIYVTAIIMILTAFLCMLYFLINGVRVLRFLNTALVTNSSSNLIKKMTILLAIGCFGLLLFVIGAVSLTLYIRDNYADWHDHLYSKL